MHISVKITKSDGLAFADKAEVAFKNNVLHSLFSDVIVTINDTIVEGGEMQYPMKSMISTLFTYGTDTMEKQLWASGFVKDDAGKIDDVANKGYVARKAWTNAGSSKEFYGKLFVDLFQQHKYMIGNVNMRIKLVKATFAEALWTNISGEKAKFSIDSAKLYLRKIRPHPQVVMGVEASLAKGAMVYYQIN
ncbi:MAG TPA: hypothetical protein VEP90_21585 [Methylomirabilota bacterium]|nr:hypothetical protein [Methylomirabilota bacterium]